MERSGNKWRCGIVQLRHFTANDEVELDFDEVGIYNLTKSKASILLMND